MMQELAMVSILHSQKQVMMAQEQQSLSSTLDDGNHTSLDDQDDDPTTYDPEILDSMTQSTALMIQVVTYSHS